MKIALFSATIDVRNGYGNITYEYCINLCKKGIDFVLFLPVSEKKVVTELNLINLPFKIEYSLPKYIFRVRLHNFLPYLKQINISGFTIVHSLFAFPYCFIAALSAKKYDLPFIMGVQGTYGVLPLTYFLEKHLLKWSYRQAKVILVPSEFTKRKILELAQENYPIFIIHNGVNFARFQKDVDIGDLKARFLGKKILLTVGGLKNRKGQDLVIKALPKLKDKFPNIKYLLVGDGDWKNYLEQLIAENNLSDFVEFIGSVKNDELVKYFKLCDIYIHTPRVVNYNFEGFGIVYLEASACKKPIIATDAGGIRDAVIENKTGLIVGDGDIQGIIDNTIKLLSDDELVSSLGQSGYEYAKEHNWPLIVDKYLELYKKYV